MFRLGCFFGHWPAQPLITPIYMGAPPAATGLS
jgi:hypothetical protein